MTASHAQKPLVSGCSYCNVLNQTPQIKHIRFQRDIGYWSTVALSYLIVQITADM